jgi:hypothetical protein
MSVNEADMLVTRYVYRYHNDSLNVLNAVLLSFALLLGLLWLFIFVQITTQPKPLYFDLNKNYELIAQVPLDQEGITTAALLNWVNDIVMDSFSYNYSNIGKQQSKLQPYFSEAAMKVYLDLLANDEDFGSVLKNRYVVSVTPKSAPDIIVGQAYQGRYAWQVQATVVVTLGNALTSSSQEMVLDFLILRVPTTDSPLGIMVATFTRKLLGRLAPRNVRSGF